LPEGFEIGPRAIKEGGQLKDEIDLLLRKNEEVYVCECFSMWRPLDIEVGEPNRIKKRLDQIEAKLDQAENTCSYLQRRRVGPGFDYRAVKSFIPIVISPFIEWLPSTSERYWISQEIPRVMTVEELAEFVSSR
jgi:tetrahydromethanopterin S-methyltransferase subunit G